MSTITTPTERFSRLSSCFRSSGVRIRNGRSLDGTEYVSARSQVWRRSSPGWPAQDQGIRDPLAKGEPSRRHTVSGCSRRRRPRLSGSARAPASRRCRLRQAASVVQALADYELPAKALTTTGISFGAGRGGHFHDGQAALFVDRSELTCGCAGCEPLLRAFPLGDAQAVDQSRFAQPHLIVSPRWSRPAQRGTSGPLSG